MYINESDLLRIEQWLLKRGIKDTQFDPAQYPLSGREQIAIVQDNKNVVANLTELISQLSEYVSFEGSTYIGIATPDTVPVTYDSQGVFYLATEAGQYINFGNIGIDGTVLAIFKTTREDPHKWVLDLTDIRLDSAQIAENAKDIADRALNIAQDTQEQVVSIENTANTALETANVAAGNALEALEEAESSVKISDRGKPGGIPILDQSGKIPLSQLPISQVPLVDSYLSTRVDAAPTANALNQLYLHHQESIEETDNILNAVLSMVSDSVEIGVAPTNITITSAAQEVKIQVICNGEWNVGAVPTGVTAAPMSGTGNGIVTLSFTANPSETQARQGAITISNSFGKEKTITYTQQAASTIYQYTLTVTPTSISVGAAAGNGQIQVVSTKTPYINGQPSGDPEQVPFNVAASSDQDWIVTGSVDPTNYSYSENVLEASRSAKLIVTQTDPAGKTVEIPVTQAAAQISKTYAFTITPANLSIADDGSGGTYQCKITSTLTTVLNNKVTTTTNVDYAVSYTGQATSAWVVYDKDTNIITLPVSTLETVRSGAIVFTQQSPQTPTITVNVTQQPATITWDYKFEYSPTSMAFGNSASSKTYSVTKSTKQKLINGTPSGDEIYVPWDVQISGTGFSLNKETNTVSVTENTGADRSGSLTFTRAELGASGNKVVSLTQSAGVVTWEYSLSASVNPTSLAAKNGTTVLTVNSTKQKYINGNASGDPIAVSWHATSKNGYLTGQDVSGSTWSMAENRTDSTRKDTLTINQLEEGGKTTTVDVAQFAGSITYDYVFNVTPATLNIPNDGTAQSVTVVSTKQKKVNGVNEGSPVDVNYTSRITEGFTINGDTISTIQNNTENQRSGTAYFTQAESSKEASVVVLQPAGTVTWSYTFIATPEQTLTFPNTGKTDSFRVTSTKQKKINGINSGDPVVVGYSVGVTGTGFSVSGTSITATPNTTSSPRTGTATLTQQESNMKLTRTLSQPAATITYQNYVFTVTPTAGLAFPRVGATKQFTVVSTRDKYVNGVKTGTEDVDYTVTTTGTGFSVSGKEITASKNPGTATRTGTATLTQIGSSTSVERQLSQAGGSDVAVQAVTYYQKISEDGLYDKNLPTNTSKNGCTIDGSTALQVGGGLIIEVQSTATKGALQVSSSLDSQDRCLLGLNLQQSNGKPMQYEAQLLTETTSSWGRNQLDEGNDFPANSSLIFDNWPTGLSSPKKIAYWLKWDYAPQFPIVIHFILSNSDSQIDHTITVNINTARALSVSPNSVDIPSEGGGTNAVTLDVRLLNETDSFQVSMDQ